MDDPELKSPERLSMIDEQHGSDDAAPVAEEAAAEEMPEQVAKKLADMRKLGEQYEKGISDSWSDGGGKQRSRRKRTKRRRTIGGKKSRKQRKRTTLKGGKRKRRRTRRRR